MIRVPSHVLCAGGATLHIVYDRPVAAPPRQLRSLRLRGRLYQQVLWEDVLEPYLIRWSAVAGDERPLLRPFTEAALERCLACFCDLRRSLPGESPEAVLGALTITANLQRTLVALTERLALRSNPAGPEVVRLSRGWCGFPPPRISPSTAPAPRRALGRAVACAPQEIEPRCQEVLRELRRELGGFDYANRSGAVRAKKSSI